MSAITNPYSDVDWATALKVPSLSHAHSRVWQYDEQPKADLQKYIERAYNGGIRHVAWSNYYPSEPFYPLDDWFLTIPNGMIGSPNAEAHSFTDPLLNNMHINSLGSYFSSGNVHGVSPVGVNDSWKNVFPKMLKQLQYVDAGGLTINHPQWSELTVPQMLKMLRFDKRVLGIEIANTWEMSEEGELIPDVWDEILLTGQRCWGFCVPDHGVEWSEHFSGRNILLVDELDEHKCLKAYRDGAFYGKLFDSNLAFSEVSLEGNTFTVSAPLADSIQIIVDGVYTQYNQSSVSVSIPNEATYCRAEAWMDYDWVSNSGTTKNVTEKIFSNPIMFVESSYDETNNSWLDVIQRVVD